MLKETVCGEGVGLEQQNAIQSNLPLKDDRVTISQYLDRFIDDVATLTLAPSTLRLYRYLIRDHIKPEIGQIKLVNLGPVIYRLYTPSR